MLETLREKTSLFRHICTLGALSCFLLTWPVSTSYYLFILFLSWLGKLLPTDWPWGLAAFHPHTWAFLMMFASPLQMFATIGTCYAGIALGVLSFRGWPIFLSVLGIFTLEGFFPMGILGLSTLTNFSTWSTPQVYNVFLIDAVVLLVLLKLLTTKPGLLSAPYLAFKQDALKSTSPELHVDME